MSKALDPTDWKTDGMRRRIRGRYASERRFKALGLAAVILSMGFLAFLLVDMVSKGAPGFIRTDIAVPVDFARASLMLDPAHLNDEALAAADIEGLVGYSADAALGGGGAAMLSEGASTVVRDAIRSDPSILKKRVVLQIPASTQIDAAAKDRRTAEPEAKATYARLDAKGQVTKSFNTHFLKASDATDPTAVGIWGALAGSLLTMAVTIVLAFPVGVLAAVYLEEYAGRNRWTELIEVSINNLAAVPSIIFGLLGLAVFLNTLHLPRSAPLVGGITLALMTMPVIVIAGRNAIKSVPPSIRDAALGVGASPVQVVFHHVLPLAMPGILTGTIIGMARALGETAPLLMIGMRAFIATPPTGITTPASVLPVQIFLWSDEVSKGFVEKTSAAIIVLLIFLLAMNGLAIYLRNKFERRWT